jgi:putative ABC transport system permease protein
MESFLNDVRFGARVLVRSPVITLWVVLALALGIGANTAMFSAVNALLLHPVDYTDPEQLVLLWEKNPQGVSLPVSAANFLDWRAQSKSFSGIAGWVPVSYVMTGPGQARQLPGAEVTANFFQTLGVRPVVGRTFLPDDEGAPASGSGFSASGASTVRERVAIIGHQIWLDVYGGTPDVLGRKIELNSVPYTIIGVAPADFHFYSRRQVWVPTPFPRNERDFRYIVTLARRRAPLSRAIAEMQTISSALDQQYPASNRGWTVEVEDLLEFVVNRTFRTRLLLLFGAIGMILLITCLNVAGLLLTRAITRSREIAVRLALGASGGRLVQQLLTESILLSLIGGVAGLATARVLIQVAPSVIPPNAIPTATPLELNGSALLFTMALSLATGIVFGMAPSLLGVRVNLQDALKDGSRGSTSGRGRHSLRQMMVALQVAVALMLLASAVLMGQSLGNLTSTNPGINMKNVVTFRLFLPEEKYNTGQTLALHQEALDRLRAIPGVVAVTAGSNLPLFGVTSIVPFDLEDAPARSASEKAGIGYISVLPGYFQTLGIPVKYGRPFYETDDSKAPPVVIVNEAFVERYYPAQNPVGKRVLLNRPALGQKQFEPVVRATIVGVAGNVRMGRSMPDPKPLIYAPQTQNTWSATTWFAVRTAGNPSTFTSEILAEMTKAAPQEPLDQIGTLEQTFANQFSEPRFQAVMMSGFAVLSLLLAVIGIYGVNAYAVAQRQHEIGVRMALGASPSKVLREVVTSGMRFTAIGIAAGLLGALAAASVLSSVLVGVSATDPFTLAAVTIVLAIVSTVACYLPARRAMRVDPAIALRQE